MKRSPGILWIKAAVIYFIMGVGLGIYMGASGDHLLVPVHAHFNLLGWASLAVIGLVYQQFPVAGSHRLATVQFWLHNAGLLAAMVLLAGFLRGNSSLDPLLGVASIVIGASVVLFAINVFQNIRE
jgi:hypothetical protein